VLWTAAIFSRPFHHRQEQQSRQPDRFVTCDIGGAILVLVHVHATQLNGYKLARYWTDEWEGEVGVERCRGRIAGYLDGIRRSRRRSAEDVWWWWWW
jgi:hypothetical protein